MTGSTPRFPRSAGAFLAVLCLSLSLACSTDTLFRPSQGSFPFSALPTGTTETLLANGLTSPTAMAVAPDGRVFVAEQCGTVRVVKNGALLPAPLLSLSVDCSGERGLLGLVTDPDFANNHRLFLYYAVATGAPHNRVSLVVVSGDVAPPGSEQIIFELDDLSTANDHNGGALHFGPDGTLYVAVGDNANSANAQTLSNTFGKILRINVDGSIPTDNPFFGTTTGRNRSIWALGLRNPFTFAFQPGTGRLFINDVGEVRAEEIDEGFAGSNYGWPTCEGICSPTNPSFRDPIFNYSHADGACAITGGTFYNPSSTRFPTGYIGKYFFADFCGGWINVFDPVTRTGTGFATGLTFPVDLQVSTDGGLYYLQRGDGGSTGQLWRIDGTANQAPTITQQPIGPLVSVGQSATFTLSATGTAPLTYQWQRDGTPIPGATAPSYTLGTTALTDDGAAFTCVVSNDFGSTPSNPAILAVTTNLPPTGTFTSPAIGTTYQGGQTITYSATADDPETGPLPASAFTWEVVFHHDAHTHPFIAPINGTTGGSFVIPSIGETAVNVYYAILLTVRDQLGLTQTFERDIQPQTSTITLQSVPTGAQLTLDGQPVTTPSSVTSVVGIQRTLGVVSPQVLTGTTYLFSNWSDAGSPTHVITTPPASTAYTATFTAPPPTTNVTFVQANANSASAQALSVSLPANTAAGNLIVVGVDWGGSASVATISDGQGNSFVPIGTQLATSGGQKTRLYYAPNIRGGVETVTVGLTGTASSLQVYLTEYRGADVTTPLDVTVQATGPSGNVTSGAAVTTAANDVVMAFCVSDGTCSAGSGFTARSTHSGNLVEDRAAVTTGSYAATGTSVGGWAIIMAAFRPQGGPVVPVATVTVSPPTATIQTGQTVQLTATPKDAGGASLAGRVITWNSNNPSLATVSTSGLVTGVAAGGPVSITATSEGQSGSASITVTVPPPPTPVTPSVTAANKAFDGTTTATITGCTLSGSPAGVTCSAAAANFSDPAVGNGKTVTATGITLGGPNVASYSLTTTSATTTANITVPPPGVTFVQGNASSVSGRTLAVSLPASSTVGNLIVVGFNWAGNANFSTITDGQGNSFTQVGSQIVTGGGQKTRLYYARNIRGGAETVTVGLSANSSSLQVYVMEYRGADITTPLDVTAQATGPAGNVTSGTAVTTATNDLVMAYCVSDGTCSAGSGFTARSTLSGNLVEDRSVTTPGSYAGTGTSVGRWAIIMAAFRPQGGSIAPVATVTVSPPTASVLTGQTVQLTATPRDANGTALTGRAITWGTSNPALATVNGSGLVTGVSAGGPVSITATSEGQSGSAGITVTAPTPVTATVTAANKLFDGTTTATITGCTLSGSPAGVTCSAAAASFSDPAVGNGKTVTATGITLGGANAANFALTSTIATTTANITAPPPPTPVTASVTAANKLFDGTTTATITSCTLSGSPAGVTCSAASASFSDAAVGNGKTVTAIGITLGGANAANYALTSTTATTTANITAPTPVTASVTAANKLFDGTTTATITSCTLSGSPAGVTCSAGAASFSDPAVGNGKTVTATGITLGGPNSAAYALTSTSATTTANITAPPPPAANVTFVQANANTVEGSQSLAVPLSASTAAGNLIVVGVDWGGSASVASISDAQGNTFTLIGTQLATPGGQKTRLYYVRNIRGGPETISVSLTGNSSSLQVYVMEYKGADITNPLDVTIQRTGPSGSVTSGSAVTTSTNDLVLAFCVSDGFCSNGSGFTARSTHSGNLVEDRSVTTPGSYAATASSVGGWAIVLAAFRPQGP